MDNIDTLNKVETAIEESNIAESEKSKDETQIMEGTDISDKDRPEEKHAEEATTQATKETEMLTEQQEAFRREGIALERIAEANVDRRKFNEALENFRSALLCYRRINDRQGIGRTLYRLGFCLEQVQKTKEARDAYEESKKIFLQIQNLEDYATVSDKLAKMLYFEGKVEDAAAEYEETIALGCKNGEVFNNLGFIFIELGRYDEARKHLLESIKIREAMENPEVHLSYNNLGVIEFIQGNYEKASEYFKTGIQRDVREPEDDRTVQFTVFLKPEYRGEKFGGYRVFQDVNTKACLMVNLAASQGMMGDMTSAEKTFMEALSLDKDHAYLYEAVGWFYINKGEDKRAIEYFNRALPYDATNEELRKIIYMINPYLNSKVGRNEPCPCGSGKKYKKCHGGVV